jgi:hypothetical protein
MTSSVSWIVATLLHQSRQGPFYHERVQQGKDASEGERAVMPTINQIDERLGLVAKSGPIP